MIWKIPEVGILAAPNLKCEPRLADSPAGKVFVPSACFEFVGGPVTSGKSTLPRLVDGQRVTLAEKHMWRAQLRPGALAADGSFTTPVTLRV